MNGLYFQLEPFIFAFFVFPLAKEFNSGRRNRGNGLQRFVLPKVREFVASPAPNQSQIENMLLKLWTKAENWTSSPLAVRASPRQASYCLNEAINFLVVIFINSSNVLISTVSFSSIFLLLLRPVNLKVVNSQPSGQGL